jgi:hypothetical protein
VLQRKRNRTLEIERVVDSLRENGDQPIDPGKFSSIVASRSRPPSFPMTSQKLQIASEGDLEVTFLFETHDLLAGLIGPDYCTLLGEPPSEVRFHSPATFGAFFVHVDELLASPGDAVNVPGVSNPLSLLAAGRWFIEQHPDEARAAGFDSAHATLEAWVHASPPFRFWCGDLDQHVSLRMSRGDMIYYAANLHKHRLLRLGRLLSKLDRRCRESGLVLNETQIIAVRDTFSQELESRLLYLASWLTEILGAYFLALNAIIVDRRERAGTNDARRMPMPSGVTSDVFRNLYCHTLVFHSYEKERIERHTPVVAPTLKMRY